MKNFKIETRNPRLNEQKLGAAYEDLTVAIENLYWLDVESKFILVWNGSELNIPYDFLGDILSEIVYMLEEICASNSGSTEITFGSNDFHCEWNFEWAYDELSIVANWIGIYGKNKEVRNVSQHLITTRNNFLKSMEYIVENS